MLMRFSLVIAIFAAVPTGAPADDLGGACARLQALLEVADFTANAENFTAIAEAGDDAACGAALDRLRAGIKGEETPQTGKRAGCPRQEDG